MIYEDNKSLRRNMKDVLYILLISFAILLIYSKSVSYPFLAYWDDNFYILNNKHLSLSFSNILFWFKTPYYCMYIPITMISYMIDYFFGGMNPVPYHVQNILWHIIASIFVYKIFRYFAIMPWLAFSITLLFAIHPQRVESVVWLSERKDVLCSAFYFMGLFFYLKNYNNKNFWLPLIFFILALLSKPMAVSLPLIFVLFEFHRSKNINPLFYIKKFWLFFLIAIATVPIAIFSQEGAIDSVSPFYLRCYTFSYNLIWYIKQTFIPYNISVVYPKISFYDTAFTILAVYIIFIYILLKIFIINKDFFLYTLVPLLLAYFFSLLPVGGLLLLGAIDHADRYSYIPSVFILLSIGLVLNYLAYQKDFNTVGHKRIFNCRHLKVLFGTMLIVFILFLASINIEYQSIWQSSKQIFEYSSDLTPSNPAALEALGDIELENKNYGHVIEIADKLLTLNEGSNISERTKISNTFAAIYFKAKALFYLGKRDEALRLFLSIEPYANKDSLPTEDRYFSMLAIMANCYFIDGNIELSEHYLNKILSNNTMSDYNRHYYTALKEFYLGHYTKALSFFELCKEEEPNNLNVLNNIKMCEQIIIQASPVKR